MEKKARITMSHRALAITAVSALAISGLALSGSINPTPAHAVSGQVSESTGVLWGIDADGGLGLYQVGTDNEGEIPAFAVSDFTDHPTAEDTYSAPAELSDLTADQRNQLAVALWVNHQFTGDGVSDELVESLNEITDNDTFPGITAEDLDAIDRDEMTAAVAGVITTALTEDFDPGNLPEDVRSSYDMILALSALAEDNEDNVFQVRTVADENKPDVLSPVDAEVAAPVVNGVTLPGVTLDTPVTGTETDTATETSITTPVTVTPTTTTTTDDDDGQDIQIRTSAGTQARNVVEDGATITDTVTFTGLVPGEEYRLVGETHYKDENGQAIADGNTGETVFTPDTPNGRIDVAITLDAVESRELVVFETLYDSDGEEIAEHKDINDRAQTVGSAPVNPTLATSVQVDGGVDPTRIQSEMTVTDLVAYTGLTPGNEYRLESRLVCKNTGEEYEDTITHHEFTPEESAGETAVEGIEVTDAECDTQVVFQKLYELSGDGNEGVLIGTHEEIDDMAQTFGKGSTSATVTGGENGGQTDDDRANYGGKSPVAESSSGTPQQSVSAPATEEECIDPNADNGPVAAEDSVTFGELCEEDQAPSEAPRQTINDVPSGASSMVGITLFNR